MKINYHESDLTLLSVYSCKRQSNFSNDKKIICFGLSKKNLYQLSLGIHVRCSIVLQLIVTLNKGKDMKLLMLLYLCN